MSAVYTPKAPPCEAYMPTKQDTDWEQESGQGVFASYIRNFNNIK